MNSLRIRFHRGEQVKFISHLDLMKAFERAARRSGLPIGYSQGFNPHPQMVFGLPLSVGVTSEAEYADFDLTREVEPREFVSLLNRHLPEGLRLVEARPKTAGGNIMAAIAGAMYELTMVLKKDPGEEDFRQKVADYLSRETITVRKEGKAGVKEINIRPMIHRLTAVRLDTLPRGCEEFEAAYAVTALLDAGSVSNIKPELVGASFAELEGLETAAVRVHRKELYTGKAGKLEDPFEGI